MAESIFFISQMVKFYKIVNYSKLVNYYIISWLFQKLTNFFKITLK